jgi:hypothetical protein
VEVFRRGILTKEWMLEQVRAHSEVGN